MAKNYKMVADYNEWVKQGDNANKDIWAIHNPKGDFLFDVLEEDYIKILDADMVYDGYLNEGVTDSQIDELREKYGILWLNVGIKFKTNNTPRECYHIITNIDDRYATTEMVYPNGMHPSESGPTKDLVKFLNNPHIGLEIIN